MDLREVLPQNAVPAKGALIQDRPRPDVGLRHFRALLALAETGGPTAAAQALCRSPSSIARSVAQIEAALEARLMDRGVGGAAPTLAGQVVVSRSAWIRSELDRLRGLLQQAHRKTLHPRAALLQMQTDLAHLRALIAVQDFRSVQRAAAFLGVSQPAVSYSIRLMEQDLGLTLFSRMSHGMIATPACTAVTVTACRILAELDRMADDVRSVLGCGTTGLVCVGGLPYSRSAILRDVICRTLDRHPGITVRTVEGPIETMLTGLHAYTIDVVICAYPERSLLDGLTTKPIAADPMGLLVARSHPLAGLRGVALDRVLDFLFILPPQGSITRRILEDFCRDRAGRPPRGQVETSSQMVIRNLLAGTDFVAFRSLREFRAGGGEGSGVVALDMAAALPERQICVVQRRATQPSGATSAFLQVVRDGVAEVG